MTRIALLGALVSAGGSAPAPSYLTIDDTVNIVIDANSIWSDDMGIPGIDALTPFTDFKTATGCTVVNTSIAGQTWEDMALDVTDVSAAYDAGKTNILVAGETRNSFFNPPMDVATCLSQIHDYLTAALAAQPWEYVVLMGCLPSNGEASAADENAGMREVDEYVRDHLFEFGAVKFIWYRDISAFAGDGASQQGFMSSPTTCLETSPPYVHPDGSARDAIATRMVRDLQEIPL